MSLIFETYNNTCLIQWAIYCGAFLLFIFAIHVLYDKYYNHSINKQKAKLQKEIQNQLYLINQLNNLDNCVNIEPNSLNTIKGTDIGIIQNSIYGLNKRPEYLTSNMVVPNKFPITEEAKRAARMEVYNMQYDGIVDDDISIAARPQGLFVIP